LKKARQIKPSSDKGVINRLEEAGYVRRTDDPKDRRRTIVEPIRNKKLEFHLNGQRLACGLTFL